MRAFSLNQNKKLNKDMSYGGYGLWNENSRIMVGIYIKLYPSHMRCLSKDCQL